MKKYLHDFKRTNFNLLKTLSGPESYNLFWSLSVTKLGCNSKGIETTDL